MRRVFGSCLIVLAATGCGLVDAGVSGETVTTPVSSSSLTEGDWTRLQDPPLSPRMGPVVAWVGGRLVVVGGFVGRPCPDAAACALEPDSYSRDGAALDLATGRWRPIADAPGRIPDSSHGVVVGERLFVPVRHTLLVWEAPTDTWRRLSTPKEMAAWSDVAVRGQDLVFASDSDERGGHPDYVLDTVTESWSTLPDDPLSPAWGRSITPTASGLVLTAAGMDEKGNPDDPALAQAALLPPGSSTWRRLPPSDRLLGHGWVWTGTRLVDPTLGGADGGEVDDYGGTLPFGGRLDPATGEWSPLPDPPEEFSGGWPVRALAGPVIADGGYLYDDAAGTWTSLERPPAAPETPGPATWAGDVLVVAGGSTQDSGSDTPADAEDAYSTGVWAYRLAP